MIKQYSWTEITFGASDECKEGQSRVIVGAVASEWTPGLGFWMLDVCGVVGSPVNHPGRECDHYILFDHAGALEQFKRNMDKARASLSSSLELNKQEVVVYNDKYGETQLVFSNPLSITTVLTKLNQSEKIIAKNIAEAETPIPA